MAKRTRKLKVTKTSSVQTVQRQNTFLNELRRQNYHITNTCKKLNMNKKVYYDWMKDPVFAKIIDRFRELEGDIFEDALRDLVKERNPQSVIFGLKTRFANRGYQEKQQIQHFGSDGIKIVFEEPGDDKVIDVKEDELDD